MKIIELQSVNKSYGQLKVLKNISLEVNKNEFISITGASGAGKTTLLQIMGTLEKPDNGNILYDSVEVTKLNDRQLSRFRNKQIGFVFQFHHLLPEFTAQENIMLPALIGGLSKREAEQKADEWLKFFGLTERKSHKPAQMSGGEQQRVAVARAVVNSPSVILADEPSGNLDSRNADELHKLFLKLRNEFEQTLVVITHNPVLASLADKIFEMKDGEIFNIHRK